MSDPVYRPPHYTRGSIETINVIEDWGLGFHLGNVIKYISRAGHKARETEIEDLKKARWYLDRHIETLEHHSEEPAQPSDDLICSDCGETGSFTARHKDDCPWVVVVPPVDPDHPPVAAGQPSSPQGSPTGAVVTFSDDGGES